MNRLKNIIASMNYRDLKSIEKDLYEGNLGKIIKQRLNDLQTFDEKTCPTCGTIVPPDTSFVLQFGRPDFRKEAHFCGIDCLDYFIHNLREKKAPHQ